VNRPSGCEACHLKKLPLVCPSAPLAAVSRLWNGAHVWDGLETEMGLTRREVLIAGSVGSAALASALFSPGNARAQDETMELVERLTGQTATVSDRLHLVMPAVFPTGYTVPMDLDMDSPMTEDDHVRRIRVFAPQNPKIIEVASFNFVPQRSIVRVSTRIRLAKPQYVVAVAEMSDGMLLMTKTWVDVATNGCA
jgi:sulfur-oxidizing protein SoxY